MGMKRFILVILLIALASGTTWAGVRMSLDGIATADTAKTVSELEDNLEGQTDSEVSFLVLGELDVATQSPSLTAVLAAVQTPSLTASLVVSHGSALTQETVTFDASGSRSGDSVITLYEWDLDGDGIFDTSSSSETWEHAYSDDGVVLVQVRVTNDLGESALSEALQLDIVNRSPTAQFEANLSDVQENSLIQFQNLSYDEDGVISSWLYDFGDGTTSNEANPFHSYGVAGTFQVTLSVTDSDGASSDIFVVEIEIPNSVPQAEFILQQSTLNVGQPLIVIDKSIDPSADGEIVHVAWDFGDGTYQAGGPSSDNVYSHTFALSGTYTITLYVIDDDGSMARAQSTITVL